MTLEYYYGIILIQHRVTAVLAKLTLLMLLLAINAGNEKPGQRLLTLTFALYFALSTMLAMGESSPVMVVAISSVIAAAGAAISYATKEGRWTVLPENPPWRPLAILGYVFAFTFPFWPHYGYVYQSFISPLGALPHQTLLVLLILCAVSYPQTPRMAAWSACIATLPLAVVDIFFADLSATLFIVALAGVVVFQLSRSGREKGWTEPDVPDATPPPREKPPVLQKEPKKISSPEPPPKKDGRKWDLK